MNKPIQVPMPRTALPILMKQGGKGKYSLSELQELIDPVYRVRADPQVHYRPHRLRRTMRGSAS